MKYLKKVQSADEITAQEYDVIYYVEGEGITVKLASTTSPLTKWYYADGTMFEKDVIGELDATTAHNGDGVHNFIALVKVEISNSVTSIGEMAFQGCSNLTSVTMPSSVTSIGKSAFYGCSSLTSVTIPNSVTSIGNQTFTNCSSLTSVTIPNSVTSIEDNAFYGCSNLSSVTIGNSVTSIGGSAFGICTSLTSVTYKGIEYTSKSALTTALTNGGVTVGTTVFDRTALTD